MVRIVDITHSGFLTTRLKLIRYWQKVFVKTLVSGVDFLVWCIISTTDLGLLKHGNVAKMI